MRGSGWKKVHIAHDELPDRDGAVSLIKAEGLNDASRQRISREEAMGRLGTDPHNVTVFDLGEHHPTAWARLLASLIWTRN